jgi:hypothetical protein
MAHAHTLDMLKARLPVTEKIAAKVMGIKRIILIATAHKISHIGLKRLMIDCIAHLIEY